MDGEILNQDLVTLVSFLLEIVKISIVIKTNVFNVLKRFYKNLCQSVTNSIDRRAESEILLASSA